MNFIRKKNIIKIIKKIFLLIFCIFFCLGVITRIYAKNKNIFLEKDYEQAEKNLIFKISVDIFGEIDSNFFENFDFIIKKVSNKKDEKECLEEIKNYFDDLNLNLRNIFLNFQKKNNSDEYKKKLEKFIKNHKIYEENSLLESEKKIAYIYKNIIVKNIYRDFFDDKLYYYKAFEKEQYDFFNDCFERYFFGSHNGKILKEYLKEFKFTKKNKDNKNYDNKNNYIFNKLNFKKYYFYDDVSCYGSHIFNKFNLKEHCFNGYCKSLLNIYLLYNINDIIKDKVFYNIGVFHVDYNKENKRNIFNLLSDLLKKNKNLYEISDIMNGYVYNQSIENNLDRIKDDENNLVSWNFLTKNGKKEVFDGTTLGNITKEYNNYYINLNGNIIPKCFIDNEENIAAYFALKEIKGEENSFLKFKWISQSQNNILCSFLNEWHLFDFVFDDNNYIKQNDYIRQKDSLVFLKNNNLLDPNQNLIFDSGSSFYIINLKKILNKSKMYQIISDDNTIKLRTLNFNSDLIINLVESLIDDDEERITNKAFDYFIKMNIKNKNIKISNDGFKKFLKRKYNF